jgi:ribosomal protein S12 methylthiotransferase
MTKKNDSTPRESLRVGLISLGCAKNLVDAEIMLGSLLKEGIEIVNDASRADVVIVNTCSFIDSAQAESVDAILESAETRRKTHPTQALIVSGCLPQRFREELIGLLPEVDAFIGIDQVAQIPDLVRQAIARRQALLNVPVEPAAAKGERRKKVLDRIARMGEKPVSAVPAPLMEVNRRPAYIPDYATPRFRLTPKHFAYVKIAEGCNHPCSFCVIPQMRGSHRSRSQKDVVAEARRLIEDGVKELNLISQDSTYYGLDLRPGASRAIASPEKFTAASKALSGDATTLCTLIRELDELPGNFWIRLLYTHPAHWTDELIQTMAASRKVVRYVDIPLQHIHPDMLERMRRETSRRHIEDLMGRIREGLPGIALRTTFIVGFPGETEACFESLLEFIRTARFERLGVFTYSQEEGTRAAKMAGQVPDRVKQRRRSLAMAEQLKVARSHGESQVGRVLNVLTERPAGEGDLETANIRSWERGLMRGSGKKTAPKGRYFVARGEADAPDIDGRVYVRGGVEPGRFLQVKIVGHTDYDLIGETCG